MFRFSLPEVSRRLECLLLFCSTKISKQFLKEFNFDPNRLSWNTEMQQLFSDATGNTKYLSEEPNKEMKEINFLFARSLDAESFLNWESKFKSRNRFPMFEHEFQVSVSSSLTLSVS